MENMKNLNDTELNEVSGGGIFDHPWEGIRAKAANGAVCPSCGHNVGILIANQACYMPGCRLFCEKCDKAFDGYILFESDFVRV